MMLPTATYRLQFRSGMDFDRAAGLAPYFRRLGVSHLYASPICQAMSGSTHGYDVTDHGALDEGLGGTEGFLRLSSALRAEGLGLILDIVPNHMAASPENPWWRDALRTGRDSRFAGHLDIDWSAPKLLVTVLGRPYGEALAAGDFALGHDAGGLVWRYYDHAFPLSPATWPAVLREAGLEVPDRLAEASWATWASDAGGRLDAALERISRDREAMHRIHEAQHWRLTYWRAARDMLTHRRFFEITDLVGVRVEDEAVFDDVHRLLFELVAEGHVHGLRVDHVDGLADPAGYLGQLKEKAPGHPPIWVEKILGATEPLPEAWPVAGTTGYEFARTVAALVTDPEGIDQLGRAYEECAGPRDYTSMLRQAKQEILTRNLAAELDLLTRLAQDALAEDLAGRDLGPDTLRRALIAVAIAMPVYRTYLGNSADSGGSDARVLQQVADEATGTADLDDPEGVDRLIRLIAEGRGEMAERFRVRLQQTTGALMAKAVEDTLFYRFNRLISANEVGAEPDHPTLDPQAFHREMADRLRQQPHGISATATHDTKRGEDARMRIAAISEAPEQWAELVGRLDALAPADDEPDPEMRWLFYQALLGAWEPDDPALTGRMQAYLVKAAREAKLHTSWVRENEAYERRLEAFAARLLGERRFREAFGEGAAPFIAMGARKSLVQIAVKLTAPGIPDIYQGTERADLSLVDPDNRREVDFGLRATELDEPGRGFDSMKTALLRYGLALRQAEPELFAEGDYQGCGIDAPLPWRCTGYVRRHGGLLLAVAVDLSGRQGGGAVRMKLPADGPLTIASVWPAGGAEVVEQQLDLTAAFAEQPTCIVLCRMG